VTDGESAGEPSGMVQIFTIDEQNRIVTGMCVRLDAMLTTAAVAPNELACDAEDVAADGVIVVTDLPLATFTVTVESGTNHARAWVRELAALQEQTVRREGFFGGASWCVTHPATCPPIRYRDLARIRRRFTSKGRKMTPPADMGRAA